VQKIAAAEPQAVLLVANTPVAGAVIKGLRAKNSPAFIFTTSTVDAEQLVTQLGAAAAGVAVAQGVPNPYKATAPIAMDFKRRMALLGIDPVRANFASLEGYIVARIVGEGLRRAGKDPQRKDLVRGLESLRRADLGGFMVDFGPGQREGSRFVDLSLIGSDGRIRQ
jgi:branched-chain amino acid transport system substrate-binding protein